MMESKKSGSRVVFLDALRGIACISVFFEHAVPRLFDGFRVFHTQYFQIGQFGVSLFFLCSGFVIPYSLERHRSLIRFCTNRFFRLFPLYWFSLICVLLLSWFGLLSLPAQFQSRFEASVLANMTMLQGFMGFEHALSPYWSLGYEMIFYILSSLLILFNLERKTVLWVSFLAILSMINGAVSRIFNHPSHLGIVFHFVTLFYGTLVFRYFMGQISKKEFGRVTFLVFVSIFVSNAFGLLGREDPSASGVRSFLPMLNAWLAAFSFFLLSFFRREKTVPQIFLRWGWVSYSIYLFHPIVIELIPPFKNSSDEFKLVTLGGWFLAVWGISEITYRWIELTAIDHGKKVLAQKG